MVSNPCRRILLPRLSESEPVILTHDQVSALVASCPAQYEPLVEVLAYGGLRIGEAQALRRNCVDLLERRIIVWESLSDANGQLSFQSPKTHQQRTLTLPRFLIDRLEEHLDRYVAADPRALLFVGSTGEPLRYSSRARARRRDRRPTRPHRWPTGAGGWRARRGTRRARDQGPG